MLLGVAIYVCEEKSGELKFTRVQGESYSSFTQLEDKTLKKLSVEMNQNTRYENCVEEEYHYVRRYISDEKQFVIAVVAMKKLDSAEKNNLFQNINYKVLKKKTATLKSVLSNPLEFTRTDPILTKIEDDLKVVKLNLEMAIDATMKRGEDLKVLESKSINLEENAKIFNKEARRVNKRCCL